MAGEKGLSTHALYIVTEVQPDKKGHRTTAVSVDYQGAVTVCLVVESLIPAGSYVTLEERDGVLRFQMSDVETAF